MGSRRPYSRLKHCKLRNKTKLNKKNIEILLNELFVLDDQQQN